MRLVAPLCAPDEVEALIKAGADELYCGIIEDWWRSRYGDHDSANRRQGAANLSTRAQLAQTVARADELQIPVYLTVNTRYTEPQLDYLTDLCLDFESMGGTGIIVSDIGLLGRLRNITDLRRCLSLLAVADNIPTIASYLRLGITRIVLPRFSTPNDARLLLQPFGGLEAEIMAFFDKCPFIDGYCRHYHGIARIDWEGTLANQTIEPLQTFDTTFKTHACLGKDQDYLQIDPCAACHLPQFEAAGVDYAKIGGRGRPLVNRVQALRFLKKAMILPDDTKREILYQRTFAHPCQCYYGELTQRRDAIEPRRMVTEEGLLWLKYGEMAPSAGYRRLMVGSETNPETLDDLLSSWDWVASLPTPLTIVIPPLSQIRLGALSDLVELLYSTCSPDTHLCVNDLGSFCQVVERVVEYAGLAPIALDSRDEGCTKMPFTLTIGSLLARIDDTSAIAVFLDPQKNPSRIVCGPSGEPRLLSYAPPSPELIRHWNSPSALEPTARATLEELFDGQAIVYEFECR